MEIYIWLLLFAVLSVIEILTINLVTIWFALSALIVFLLNLIFGKLESSSIIFSALSMLFLILLKPIFKKYFENINETRVGDIGAEVIIVKIENDEYVVKYKGGEWMALSKNKYKVGEKVKIISFEGNKIII